MGSDGTAGFCEWLQTIVFAGGYGHVHKGWDNNRKQVVALKYMNNAEDKSISQATLREGEQPPALDLMITAVVVSSGSHSKCWQS